MGDQRVIRVQLLGPVSATIEGRSTALRGRLPAVLLSLLAVQPGRTLSADQLIERAWTGSPPPTAGSALRVHITKIRQAFAPLPTGLATTARGYRLDPAVVSTDVAELATLTAGLEAVPDPAEALARVDRALALFQGRAFAGFVDDDELRAEAGRLDELRLDLEESRAELLLALGRHGEASTELVKLVRAQPLRERRSRLLMLAQYRSGRQAEALATYGDLRNRLSDELGLDPSGEARELEVQILRQDASLTLRGPQPGPAKLTDAGRPRALRPAAASADVLLMVVAGRLAALDEATARLVKLAAIMDDAARPAVLASAMGREESDLAALGSRAAASGLLELAGEGRAWRVPRRERRNAVLQSLSEGERAALHALAGQALLKRGTVPALVRGAWHLIESGRHALGAGRAAVRAVDACLEQGASRTADDLCLAALDVLPASSPVAVDLLTRRVRTLTLLGRTAEVEAVWRAAIEAARASGDASRFALAVLAQEWAMRSFHVVNRDLRTLLTEALARVGPGPTALRTRLVCALMMDGMLGTAQLAETERLADEIRSDAEATGDPVALASACRARHTVLRGHPDFAARAQALDAFLAAAQQTGDEWWAAISLLGRLYDLFVVGRHAEVPELLMRLDLPGGNSAATRVSWHHALTQASLARDRGDLASAIRWGERGLLRGAEAGIPDAPAASALNQFLVVFLRGSTAALLPHLHASAQQGAEHAMALAIVAIAEAQAGNRAAAGALIGRALDRLPQDSLEAKPVALACAAQAAAASGLADLAPRLDAELRPYSGQFATFGQVTATFGPVDRCLGLLSALQGDADRSVALLAAAQRQAATAALVPWEVLSAADAVGVLRSSGRLAEAEALASEHRTTAARLGLQGCLARFSAAAS